ncbi:MAG: DUF4175 domain-containing protein [Planctomycetota bacterium]|nr:DUF4175 domain-containing protein [Planctomycetota bacterium]
MSGWSHKSSGGAAGGGELPRVFADYSCIGAFLRGFVWRHRWLSLLAAVGWGMAIASLALLASCLTDRLLHLPRGARVLWLLFDLGVLLVAIFPAFNRLLTRHINWIAAANQVERATPDFGQRLQTVISQMFSDPAHRGSPMLLDAILRDLDRDLAARNSKTLIRWWPLRTAWSAVGIVCLLGAILLPISWLGMPRLLSRALNPWRDLSPVTTTTLVVEPGDAQVPQGHDLNITVAAERLGDELPVIALSQDGRTWQRQTMTYLSVNHFSCVVPDIERDLMYFVVCGDAQTPQFNIRALRPPAVIEFRYKYSFPDYVLRPPLLPSQATDGMIEAPIGTQVTLSVVSTEPLASTTLTDGATHIELTPAGPTNIRQCRLRVDHDSKLDLSMVSDRGVIGKGPAGMAMHAVADLPPTVRFLQPMEDLRLSPRDILQIGYLATDDYGVTTVGVRAQVNQSPAQEFDAVLSGDPQYRRGLLTLDLGMLGLKVEDVVRLRLIARDGAGHETVGTEERCVLISQRAVDYNARLRMAAFQQAQGLADQLANNLDAAAKSLQAARRAVGDADARDHQWLLPVRERLSAAADASALLRQTLLRAIVHSSSARMSAGLAGWLDRVQSDTGTIYRATRGLNGDGQGVVPARIAAAPEDARRLAQELEIVASGEVAASLVALQLDINAPSTRPVSAPDLAVAQRFDEEFRNEAASLDLDPAAMDFAPRLATLIEQAKAFLIQVPPTDYSSAAADWAAALKQGQRLENDLDARLALAAEAESLRPDSNPVRANDLQLASRAAKAIQSLSGVSLNSDEFPPALADLQREHAMPRGGNPRLPEAQVSKIRAAADIARQKMAAWAGQVAATSGEAALDQSAEHLDAALKANADTARRDYAAAKKADESVIQTPISMPVGKNPNLGHSVSAASDAAVDWVTLPVQAQRQAAREQVRDAMQLAQAVEELKMREDQLIANVATVNSAQERTDKQQELSIEIARLEQQPRVSRPANTQGGATTIDPIIAIRAAMLRLSAMQAQLDSVQRTTTLPSTTAVDITITPQATARLVSPEVADVMTQGLIPFESQTEQSVVAIGEQLKPALAQLEQAISSDDTVAIGHAVALSHRAVGIVLQRLRASLGAQIDQNPMAAAQYFSQEAAKELARVTEEGRNAAVLQRSASYALSRAWAHAAHEAAEGRLAQVPAFDSILSPDTDDLNLATTLLRDRSPADTTPPANDWGSLGARGPRSLSASNREGNAAGYEEAVKAYFEALNRGGGS